ncbi:MAG: aminoacyl-histidine dipeptidase [Lachnospirales bacterium]
MALEGLKPEKVFYFFEEINKIPRGSGNERAVSNYLVNFAKERNLKYIQDDVLNVVIYKDGTGNSEKPVILQGHMDMVCEKNENVVHDFLADPIDMYVDGDLLRARGTTLGADNGIAVAMSLAILDAKDIKHPPLEVLITIGEETGMEGAKFIEGEYFKGDTLINIDNSEESKFIISCAGGVRAKVTYELEHEYESGNLYEISVSDLKGGHSGADIDKHRGNAVEILARIIREATREYRFKLVEINGGNKDNAIPREAKAKVLFPEENSDIISIINLINVEFMGKDTPTITSKMTEVKDIQCIDEELSKKIINSLILMPNGPLAMSSDIEGLVETSSNLASIQTTDDFIIVKLSLRSSVASAMLYIAKKVEAIGEITGAKVCLYQFYNGWQYSAESKIRDIFLECHKDVYGKNAEATAIHAGLECGILSERLGDLDMISIGPNIFDLHTPEERLDIPSTERVYNLLKNVLGKLA